MKNIIKICNLTKDFGKFRAVDGLNLQIKGGEVFSLLGENGAGKTTTIKILCSLLEKTSGEVVINGYNLQDNPEEIKKIINISPQETAVAPNLTVRENLELMASLYGLNKTRKELAEKLINDLGLISVAEKKAKHLSGGQQRRCSIAMALITKPKILFLDEPTLGLDVRARRELWKVIEGLKGQITVVLTTHYMEEAESLSDRVAIMKRGKIVALGTPEQLKNQANVSDFEEAFLKLTEGGEDCE